MHSTPFCLIHHHTGKLKVDLSTSFFMRIFSNENFKYIQVKMLDKATEFSFAPIHRGSCGAERDS